jgi:hypothetical protein
MKLEQIRQTFCGFVARLRARVSQAAEKAFDALSFGHW